MTGPFFKLPAENSLPLSRKGEFSSLISAMFIRIGLVNLNVSFSFGWGCEQKWPGPPDPVLDGGPYTAEVTTENGWPIAVRLTSPKDRRTGIQFSRLFKIFDDTTHVNIEATMKKPINV